MLYALLVVCALVVALAVWRHKANDW